MPEKVNEQKKNIRSCIKEQKKTYSVNYRNDNSVIILDKIEQTDIFRNSKTILIYNALPDEVQTMTHIIRWAKKKRIVLPVVNGDSLELREYSKEEMEKGAFGIYEPRYGEIVDPKEIDMAIVPGIAFDNACRRLGRGKGYYDRTLISLDAPKIGIGFSFQIIDSVPTELHDQALDYIFTEKDIFKLI